MYNQYRSSALFIKCFTSESLLDPFFCSAVGGSTNVCSDVYSGSQPFSEKESQAVETFILNNRQNMMAYLTYHSYGQMWLYPWGYTSALPADWQDLVSFHPS